MKCNKPPVISVVYLSTALFLALGEWFSNLSTHRNHWGFVEKEDWTSLLRVSDSLGLGWGLIIFISNKFTAEATGLKIIVWEQSPLPCLPLSYFNTSLFSCGTFSRKVCWMFVYFTFYYGNFQIYAKIKNKITNATYHYLASTVSH